MKGQHSDYYDANSFAQNELDQSTSTATLVRGNTPQKPLRPVVQHYLKAFIKITREETKAAHHLETLEKALEDKRPPKGLTPSIKHNISNLSSYNLSEAERNLLGRGLNQHNLENIQP